jgi:hypothetical protein
MGTGNSSGTVNLRVVAWAPNGTSSFTSTDPSYFTTVLTKFVTDIASASGGTGNVFGIMPEYSQTLFGVTTKIKYSLAIGSGSFVDTTPYPATGQCTAQNGPANDPLQNNYTACLTQAQVQSELSSQITARGLPTGLDNLYIVLFPPNVQTQLGSSDLSSLQFCGYHSSFKIGTSNVIWANEPFPTSACPAFATPNNDTYGDAQTTVLEHEIVEAITDPLVNTTTPAWFDSSGNEIGDECNFSFGPALGTVATTNFGNQNYNQVINGDKFYIQTEFSNAAYAATGVGTGCRQTAFSPAARPRHVRHDQAGMATQLTVDGSPTTLPADGSSTSTITITATDANGDPVAGDPVLVSTRDDNATPGGCGTLSTGLAGPGSVQTTDANGQVHVTYTASSVSSDCYVLATDVNAGITDQALLYQGSEESTAPVITESTLPASLVSGGPSATFTATASNPSGSAIHDARFGIYITGDSNGTTGLNASQLTLSYQDEATHGDFINVPLSGTTAGDGQITGLVSTDTAEALAAGATRHATFQLDLAGNAAADTATTGANLHIQIALDQIDLADGSLTNLDQSTPGDVPVVQEPGHTITYAGKLVTTSPPSGSTPGTAILEAKTCHFTSDNAACRLTGTASFTAAGGTLSGTITTDPAPGVPDLVITFTETFTTSQGGGTGTGTAQVVYFVNGNSSTQNLSASYTTKPDKLNPAIQNEEGTLTITNPTP